MCSAACGRELPSAVTGGGSQLLPGGCGRAERSRVVIAPGGIAEVHNRDGMHPSWTVGGCGWWNAVPPPLVVVPLLSGARMQRGSPAGASQHGSSSAVRLFAINPFPLAAVPSPAGMGKRRSPQTSPPPRSPILPSMEIFLKRFWKLESSSAAGPRRLLLAGVDMAGAALRLRPALRLPPSAGRALRCPPLPFISRSNLHHP